MLNHSDDKRQSVMKAWVAEIITMSSGVERWRTTNNSHLIPIYYSTFTYNTMVIKGMLILLITNMSG